jgi:bifunctional DNase/RNase
MTIGTVLFDQAKGAAMVTLVEEGGDRMLPIFIGIWEGMAIFRELHRAAAHRPTLHDLVHNILLGFQARIDKVIIDALSEGTYYAQVYVTQNGTTMIADARPSDALGLAVKFQAAIYVAEAVLEAAGKRSDMAGSAEATAASTAETTGELLSTEDVHAWLENVRPEDFAEPQ